MADSPDAVAGCVTSDGTVVTSGFDVKTMTAERMRKEAENLRETYGCFCNLRVELSKRNSLRTFQDIVKSPEYRCQCIYHDAIFGVNTVLHILSSSGKSSSLREIVMVTRFDFADDMLSIYRKTLESVRSYAFRWIGNPARKLPVEVL